MKRQDGQQGSLPGAAHRHQYACLRHLELAEELRLHGVHHTTVAAAAPRLAFHSLRSPPQRHDSRTSGPGRRLLEDLNARRKEGQ